MAQQKKLIKSFLSKPKDFTFEEMRKLLGGFGYREMKRGKTSGSRVVFFNEDIQHIIRIHTPHPKNILKRYQLNLIEEELRKREVLK
jgi:hypothetical protein